MATCGTVVSFPKLAAKRERAPVYFAVGFESGHVRFFSEVLIFVVSSLIAKTGGLLLTQLVSPAPVAQIKVLQREGSDDIVILSHGFVALVDGVGILQSLRYCSTQIDKGTGYDPDDVTHGSLLALRRWQVSGMTSVSDFICLNDLTTVVHL
jgi:hypothetical protein